MGRKLKFSDQYSYLVKAIYKIKQTPWPYSNKAGITFITTTAYHVKSLVGIGLTLFPLGPRVFPFSILGPKEVKCIFFGDLKNASLSEIVWIGLEEIFQKKESNYFKDTYHGQRTPREEIAFTARPKI